MRDEHIDIDLENTYSKNENTDLGNSDPQNTKHKTQNTKQTADGADIDMTT